MAKKVLILHGQPGMGHLMVAKSIKEAFLKKYPDIEVRDADSFDFCFRLFKYGYPFLYNHIVFRLPIIYKTVYGNYENKFIQNIIEQVSLLFTKKQRFISFINDFAPDFILFTNPLPLQLVSLIREKNIANILSATVCTDFGFHPMWHNLDVNYYFVANEKIKESFIKKGVEPEAIKITGIPIRQKFNKIIDQQKVLAKLNFEQNHPVLLIVGGQLSYNELLKMVVKIKERNNNVQFVIVAVCDKSLYKKLKTSKLKNDDSVRLFGLVDNLEEFMSVSDLIISKSGGSTTAECLAMGLPMVVKRVIPGQEEDNIEYLVENKAGLRVKNIEEMVEKIIDLFSHPEKLAEMKERCKKIAIPKAADDLVDFVVSKTNIIHKQDYAFSRHFFAPCNFAKLIKKNINNRVAGELAVLVALLIILIFSLNPGHPLGPFLEKLEPSKTIVNLPTESLYASNVSYEQAIIDSVKQASPSVVSIVISKNLPIYEQEWINPFGENSPFDFQIPQYVQKGSQLQEIGAGSGFIVSEDGLVLTNKHVVIDKSAEYTVFTNDGQKYAAKVLALDPVQDLAVIKVQSDSKFQPIKLGDSSSIQLGQTAIAIGNALGEFRNTVSVGIISGLGRTVSASNQTGSFSETLEGIIQTDAAINAGNSGGPLLNLKGEVIGINTAMAEGAENVGFAIPVNFAKKDIDQVIKTNKIVYPFLGVRYILINDEIKDKYKLTVDYGALVLRGEKGEAAVVSGSAADKAGIKGKDIILEINEEKITQDNSMSKIIQKYNAGDKVTLKILRKGAELNVDVTLGERNS